MSIALSVYKTRRVHLVRFVRAAAGDPDAARPDLDDRGYGGERGPVIGVVEGSSITVRLKRIMIDPSASLVVKSSDAGAFTVTSPADGRVPAGAQADIELRGVTGGNPRVAKLEVRFQSDAGPVLHELTVWVFQLLQVRVAAHTVSIASAAAPAVTPTVPSVPDIITRINAIWRPCGVEFVLREQGSFAVTLATAGVLNDALPVGATGEFNALITARWRAAHLNVYFVYQLTSGALGLGFSKVGGAQFTGIQASTWGVSRPSIFLPQTDGAGFFRAGIMDWANDLGHEMGHWTGLGHPYTATNENTYSRRRLMHHNHPLGTLGDFRDDIGYGNLMRGCLVPMKDLAQSMVDDSGCTVSRRTINNGPYA